MNKLILFGLMLGICIIGFGRCEKNTRPKPIDENKFVQIYCDVVMYAELIDSKLRKAFVDSVLAHHKVTREKYQQSIEVYSKDKKRWKQIFEKVVAELEQKEKALAAQADSTRDSIQTIKRIK